MYAAHHFSVLVCLHGNGSDAVSQLLDCWLFVTVCSFESRHLNSGCLRTQTKQNMSYDTNWPEACVSVQCRGTEYVFPPEYYELYQSAQPVYRGFLN